MFIDVVVFQIYEAGYMIHTLISLDKDMSEVSVQIRFLTIQTNPEIV